MGKVNLNVTCSTEIINLNYFLLPQKSGLVLSTLRSRKLRCETKV